MIDVACNCGAKFRVAAAHAGNQGRCPNCNTLLIVPNQHANGIDASSTTDRESGSAASKTVRKIACVQCGAPVPELTYSCPYCGGSVTKTNQTAEAASRSVKIGSVATSQSESSVGSLMNFLDGGFGSLRREAANIPNSPEDLVTFFSRHIGGVGEMNYGPIHRQACQGSLTKLRIFAANDAKLAKVVRELERQLDAAPKAKSPEWMIAMVMLACMPFLIILWALGSSISQKEGETRSQINALVREGRHSEARILAEEISGLKRRESILETIEKAESNDRP